jgi:hypothetical protein
MEGLDKEGQGPISGCCTIKKEEEYLTPYNFIYILYGCGTWSITLKEEHRLGVFKNRTLRLD